MTKRKRLDQLLKEKILACHIETPAAAIAKMLGCRKAQVNYVRNVVAKKMAAVEGKGGGSSTQPPKGGALLDTILDQAKETIYGRDRQTAYGPPKEHFEMVSALWSGYLNSSITPSDVCIMMALLKVARLAQTPDHHDSQVDAAGYFGLLERVQK